MSKTVVSIGAGFHIEKATGTHADIFAAVGLADLLATATEAPIYLKSEDHHFTVEMDPPLDPDTLDELAIGAGYPYLRPKGLASLPPGVINWVDYEAERDRARRYRELRQQAKAEREKGRPIDPALQQALEENAPRKDWRLLQVAYMLTNHLSPNRVHATMAAREEPRLRKELSEALGQLARGASPKVDWKADAVQLFSPTAAKGYARLKPDSTDRNDKTKDQQTNAFIEWLRFRGYFRVACPFFQGSKGEHIRVYTPIPADISLRQLTALADHLWAAPLWGAAPKLDALAVLQVAQYLIEHSAEAQTRHGTEGVDAWGLPLQGRTPAEVVEGVAIAHYQSLGSAKAVSALTTLAVPGWFPVNSPEAAEDWLEILDEHRRVIRGLDDSHSDEIGLLISYRRFLERRGEAAVTVFLDFCADYGIFLMRAWGANRRVRAFRTKSVGRLLNGMSPHFAAIVADPGFEAVARAVRRATVQAQFRKARKEPNVREIRYDLLPELRRARMIADPNVLVEAVADFVAKYNYENARRHEQNKKPIQANVHTDEFASFLRLVDTHGASVVGALLGAYGTCVEPRPGEDESGPISDSDTPDSGLGSDPDSGIDASEEE